MNRRGFLKLVGGLAVAPGALCASQAVVTPAPERLSNAAVLAEFQREYKKHLDREALKWFRLECKRVQTNGDVYMWVEDMENHLHRVRPLRQLTFEDMARVTARHAQPDILEVLTEENLMLKDAMG